MKQFIRSLTGIHIARRVDTFVASCGDFNYTHGSSAHQIWEPHVIQTLLPVDASWGYMRFLIYWTRAHDARSVYVIAIAFVPAAQFANW